MGGKHSFHSIPALLQQFSCECLSPPPQANRLLLLHLLIDKERYRNITDPKFNPSHSFGVLKQLGIFSLKTPCDLPKALCRLHTHTQSKDAATSGAEHGATCTQQAGEATSGKDIQSSPHSHAGSTFLSSDPKVSHTTGLNLAME